MISSEKVLEAFETFTSSLLGGWIKNIEQNVVLSELRDALLPKLLTGELAPNQLHQTRNQSVLYSAIGRGANRQSDD